MHRDLITMQEAAAMLGCTWQTVRYYIRIGRLTGVQLRPATHARAHRWAVKRKEVERLRDAYAHEDTNYLTYSQAARQLNTTRFGIETAISKGYLKPLRLTMLMLDKIEVAKLNRLSKDLITMADAAKILGKCPERVRQLVKAGVLAVYDWPFGRLKRLKASEVRLYQQSA